PSGPRHTISAQPLGRDLCHQYSDAAVLQVVLLQKRWWCNMSDPHALASGQDLGPTLSGQERSHPGGIGPKERRKVVVASFIGNFTEWFDYGAYSYLAVVIATV